MLLILILKNCKLLFQILNIEIFNSKVYNYICYNLHRHKLSIYDGWM